MRQNPICATFCIYLIEIDMKVSNNEAVFLVKKGTYKENIEIITEAHTPPPTHTHARARTHTHTHKHTHTHTHTTHTHTHTHTRAQARRSPF